MKKLLLLLAIIFAASSVFIGCAADEITELAFRNSPLSDDKINEIVWVKDNIEWSKTGGYDKDTVTHSQEVDSLDSSVDCLVYDPGFPGFVIADVIFPSTGSNSLSLDEGNAYIYTLEATIAK